MTNLPRGSQNGGGVPVELQAPALEPIAVKTDPLGETLCFLHSSLSQTWQSTVEKAWSAVRTHLAYTSLQKFYREKNLLALIPQVKTEVRMADICHPHYKQRPQSRIRPLKLGQFFQPCFTQVGMVPRYLGLGPLVVGI